MTALFLLLALLAEIIGTIAGFGSSTILLPIALLFFDFPLALSLVAIFHIFGNLGRLTLFRHGLNRTIFLHFGIPSIALAALGALLVTHTPNQTLKLILGLFLFAFSATSLARPNFSLKPTVQNTLIGGALSGFLAGLIGTGGALRGAFLTAYRTKKETYLATTAAIALAVDLTRLPIYLSEGFLAPAHYFLIPFLFITALLGAFIGKKAVTRLPQETFRKTVLVLIALIALKFITDAIPF
ncbi:sulfite exporter TauE/SafE family protein [Candidatus Woesearchaeota archaeon]|nr:MAG: sulfite exporter TauE/SafE family protein [Candidatus Woesearchaeota archaeon]